jgi:hypothetical protein
MAIENIDQYIASVPTERHAKMPELRKIIKNLPINIK